MKYREIILNIPKEIAEDFTTFLDEIGVAGYYEILFDREVPRAPHEEIISDDTKFRVYLAQEDNENETKILIYLKANAGEVFFSESRWIETKEYEEAYKEFYKPFIVGSYRVIPTWEKDTALGTTPEGIFPLFINPGLAFGTGHHETTRLVLGRMGNLSLSGKKGCGRWNRFRDFERCRGEVGSFPDFSGGCGSEQREIRLFQSG